MKRLLYIGLISVTLGLFSSCGINNALVGNFNQNTTHVQLSTNNYEIVAKVDGSAEVKYILGIGGLNKKRLYENAYADMVSKADLMSGSKALVNIVTEDHIWGVPPFYTKRTVTVSAHVVKFTR